MLRLFPRMAVLAILPLWTIGAQADTISLVPSSTDVEVGSTFYLDIIGESLNLGAFDLAVGFSPLLVGVDDVSPDVFLGDTSVLEAIFSPSILLDTVQISEVSFLDPAALLSLQSAAPGNSFRLARMTLQASAPGIAAFSFGQTLLSDPDANVIDATFLGTSVTISGPGDGGPVQIPEPASWSLLATAALLLFVCSSAKKRMALKSRNADQAVARSFIRYDRRF